MNKKYQKPGVSARPSVVPEKKRHLKRAVIVVLAVFALLIALCLALYGAQKLLQDRGSQSDKRQTPLLDGKNYINFYEPDYDANIYEDKDYLAKNRSIRYVVPGDGGSVGIVLDEYDDASLTEGQRFFKRYFKALADGDTEAYHGMFTAEYIAEPEGFETHPADREFPMQRVYDITVTELGRSDPADTSFSYNGEPAVFGVYEVRYKILKNDGELRYDLPENGENPLIFELVTTGAGTENEKTLIKNQYKYADIRSE